MRWVVFGGLLWSIAAAATPSSQIWIPSTDVQAPGSWHLGLDNYVRTSSDRNSPNYYDLGLTHGMDLSKGKLGLEVGIDYLEGGQGGPALGVEADRHPIYFNAKVGVPEGGLFDGAPAIALGGYALGTHSSTAQNILYGLAARTLGDWGRISIGGYRANETVISSGPASGLLLSWDRVLREVSDRLWVGLDYLGGENALGAVSAGASWAFTDKVSVIFGYDAFNSPGLGGSNCFTTQVDINFP